jgi:nitrite reductase/ring-hydroxylating ferredoxin subunit
MTPEREQEDPAGSSEPMGPVVSAAPLLFAADGQRALCRLEDIPDGASKGFAAIAGGFTGLMAVRRGNAVFVYVNSCPHIGTPLDWTPDRFLSRDGRTIVCATHGAQFRIDDGVCINGPCIGDRLEAVPTEIRDGTVYVPEGAGL